jgi:hypothetical protein
MYVHSIHPSNLIGKIYLGCLGQYIAERLLKLNERGRWEDPPPSDPVRRGKQDEEIFQTARLVKCVHYVLSVGTQTLIPIQLRPLHEPHLGRLRSEFPWARRGCILGYPCFQGSFFSISNPSMTS